MSAYQSNREITAGTPLLASIPSSAKSNEQIDEVSKETLIAKKTLIGMVCVASAATFFCTSSAIVQYNGGSVLELTLGRYVVQNMIAWSIWLFKTPESCGSWYGDPPYRIKIWLRGFFFWITSFTWWMGVDMLPLGDAQAIYYIKPVLLVIVARLYLKEPLQKSFILTFILTLAGLTFICQPSFIFSSSDSYETISWLGALFMIICAVTSCFNCIIVRLSISAHWLQFETVATTQGILLWTPLVILCNQLWWNYSSFNVSEWSYDAATFGVLAIIGILCFFGLMLYVIGYQIGNATTVAWMEYLDLVLAFAYQWFAFGDVPNTWEFVGGACLIATCIIPLTEEYLKYRKCKDEEESLLENNAS